MAGRDAKDITLNIPVGTLVYEVIRPADYKFEKRELRVEKEYKKKLIADFDTPSKEVVVCKGGQGGLGNATKRNMFKDNPLLKGKEGEEKELVCIKYVNL
jgi:GTPase involved in cell partitioning and DNA repair